MKIKLKKECPFCGGKEVDITDREAFEQAQSGAICISCMECKTDVWYFGDFNKSYAFNTKAAIDKWNQRFKAWDEP